MKNTFILRIVFFIIAITAKDFLATGWQIWYHANKQFAATELCENTSRPELKCNGKCYLAKQLAKGENGSERNEAPKLSLKLKSHIWIAEAAIVPADLFTAISHTDLFFADPAGIPVHVSSPVFRPPAV